MLFSELIGRFRSDMRDKAAGANFSNGDITSYANAARNKMFLFCRYLKVDSTTALDNEGLPLCSFPVVANTAKYSHSPKIIEVVSVKLASKTYPLSKIPSFRAWNLMAANPGTPVGYCSDLNTDAITLLPTPKTSDTAGMTVWRFPLKKLSLNRSGSVTLSGSGGSISSLKINDTESLLSSVAFNTNLSTTAAALAAAINAGPLASVYLASSIAAVITIMEKSNSTDSIDDVSVSSVSTGMILSSTPLTLDNNNPLDFREEYHEDMLPWMLHLAFSKDDPDTGVPTFASHYEAKFKDRIEDIKMEVYRRFADYNGSLIRGFSAE